MGAELLREREDSALILEWYRSGKNIFGYGQRPEVFTEQQLIERYAQITQSVQGIQNLPRLQQLRVIAHTFRDISVLEFEVAFQSLVTRFPSEVLHGMTVYEMQQLFHRYSLKHAETIPVRNARRQSLKECEKNKIIKIAWFGTV
ncbi:hypothetical protein HY483_04035 [Candidatus Woesearchaeota archaeon]|nr:hypothetical protein [Candidatus Woesearchaeota archaeon]